MCYILPCKGSSTNFDPESLWNHRIRLWVAGSRNWGTAVFLVIFVPIASMYGICTIQINQM